MSRESQGAARQGAARLTANDRFKQSFGAWLWGSVIVATVFHFGLFAFFPELTASDVSFAVNELEAIELPPEVEIPPPPELEEDITIAPTTFEENPIENLPPPPSDASRLGDQPVFTPFEVRPEMKNSAEIQRLLQREYPRTLKDAGIGGTVNLWVFIDTQGNVENAKVQKGSGYQALDQAALRVANRIQFSPALNRDQRVPVWISIPITFSVKG